MATTTNADRAGMVQLGLIAAPGVAAELAEQLAEELPEALGAEVSENVDWSVPVVAHDLATGTTTSGIEMIDRARDRMRREGWHLAVCLTDLPLRIGRRPVVADVSVTHGVALLSLPALGAVQQRRRAREAVTRLVAGLLGEGGASAGPEGDDERRRNGLRLAEIAAPVRPVTPQDGDIDLRFVAAVVRGNLRLLAGMVRSNRPWRVVARLSRALGAALAAVAFALVTSDIWRLASSLDWPRLLALSIISLTAIVVSLITAHGLWEHSTGERDRERVVLFNLATTVTVALGVATLYAALFVLTLAGAGLVLDPGPLRAALEHDVSFADYARLAWFVSSLATVGGALGAGLESDIAVREAAYGYRPERDTERDADLVD
jgi:hypothetical protein